MKKGLNKKFQLIPKNESKLGQIIVMMVFSGVWFSSRRSLPLIIIKHILYLSNICRSSQQEELLDKDYLPEFDGSNSETLVQNN